MTKQPEIAPRPRRGRPAIDAAERRKRIMAAAIRLFTEKGYTATTMTDIAQAAGMTKRSIYQAIGDKDALFRGACAELCAHGGDFGFGDGFDDLPLEQVLRTMARTVVGYALDPETVAFSRAIAMETLRFPELVVSVMNVGRVVLNRAIADVFERLMRQGRITVAVPSRAADIFYDAIVGSRPLRAVMGYDEPCPTAEDLDERVRILIAGYFDPEPSRSAHPRPGLEERASAPRRLPVDAA